LRHPSRPDYRPSIYSAEAVAVFALRDNRDAELAGVLAEVGPKALAD
jgi:hypothetical protein